MSKSNGSSSRKKATESIDEVEELLGAARDDMLLKLSLNSHIARSGSSSQDSTIDADLDRRFQALKAKPKVSATSKSDSENPKVSATSRSDSEKKYPEKVVDNIDESDDLFARFAALKKSLPSYSSSSISAVSVDEQVKRGQGNESEGEEDEVEKVINWAIDAARLDPSPPSDVDDDSDSEKDSDDEDNDRVDARRKSKRK